MDIDYFLKIRTEYIKYFYETATTPFLTIKNQIDNNIHPFSPSEFYENEEPEYLEEWQSADRGLETVSHTCISMLHSSLHLFMESWFSRLKTRHGMEIKLNFKKEGWFVAYKEEIIRLDFPIHESKVNFDIIEQILLARNRIQHPEKLVELRVSHSKSDLLKHKKAFFISEEEKSFLSNTEESSWWLPPSVTASKEKIFEAIFQVEEFASWLEKEYWKACNAHQATQK